MTAEEGRGGVNRRRGEGAGPWETRAAAGQGRGPRVGAGFGRRGGEPPGRGTRAGRRKPGEGAVGAGARAQGKGRGRTEREEGREREKERGRERERGRAHLGDPNLAITVTKSPRAQRGRERGGGEGVVAREN
jgi:hypothetical protein